MFYKLVNRELHEMSEVLEYEKILDLSHCYVLHINSRESGSRPVLTYHAELYHYI